MLSFLYNGMREVDIKELMKMASISAHLRPLLLLIIPSDSTRLQVRNRLVEESPRIQVV